MIGMISVRVRRLASITTHFQVENEAWAGVKVHLGLLIFVMRWHSRLPYYAFGSV